MRTTILVLLGFLPACSFESSFTQIVDYSSAPSDTGEQVVEDLPPQVHEEPEECPDRIWSATEISVDESCRDEPEKSLYFAVNEWTMKVFEEYPDHVRHLVPPMVGQMNDDNMDGFIDDLDTPDVVIISGTTTGLVPGVLRVISGDGSLVHWSQMDFEWKGSIYSPIQHSTVALGDVDVDGVPDIVTLLLNLENETCHYAQISAMGEIQRLNTDNPVACRVSSAAISDMEGDGSVEVILGNSIFNGEDGSLQGQGTHGIGASKDYWNKDKAFAIDLDGDGVQELITGNTLYNPLGEELCRMDYYDGFPAAADMNGDGLGEVVVSGNHSIQIYDHNCNPLVFWPLPDPGIGGPATIADYDGDGEPEIGIASHDFYFVFEADGTLLWQNPVNDSSSNCTGSAVYDFEGDGYAEVVYADQEDLWVYSGVDGFVKLRDSSHRSGTANEYPIIVDVDGDGAVEIVVADDYSVRVVGSADGSWVPARKVWNQYAYHISNINDDLSVPSPTPVNWPEWNNFRSGDIRLNNGEGALHPDAIPVLVDTCEIECEQGILQVVIQLGNSGLASVPGEIPISLYAESMEELVLLQTIYTENPVVSGRSNPGLVVVLDPADVPDSKLWIVVDDDGAGGSVLDECNEENNAYLIEDGLCQ
jgi:hypothetical protein